MRFEDRVLMRLADAAERGDILSADVGRRILQATYRLENRHVQAVTGVHTRRFDLLSPVTSDLSFRSTFRPLDSGTQWEGAGTLASLQQVAFVDAQLDLLITATTRIVDTSIEAVEIESLAHLGDLSAIDARIATEDGGLPGDVGALDARRFEALKAMFKESLDKPDDLDIDHFLSVNRIGSTAEFVDFLTGNRAALRMALDLAIVPRETTQSEDFPVRLAVRIVENPFDQLHDLLKEIQFARVLLERAGRRPLAPEGLTSRTEFSFLVIFQEAALDDEELPMPEGTDTGAGADVLRSARLAEASKRLLGLGIALAAV